MTRIATAGDATVTERRVAELGGVLHRQRQARVGSYVAGFAGRASKRNVVRRRCNNRKTVGRYCKSSCRCNTMALCTIGTGRWRVGMDGSNGRHRPEIRTGMTGCTTGRWRYGYVIGGLCPCHKIYEVRMATGTIIPSRMRRVGHTELRCDRLRARLKALERRACGDGVLRYTDPDSVGLMTTRAVARHTCMNHRRCRCRVQKTAAWNPLHSNR